MPLTHGDPLTLLQEWYQHQVNGEWEHTYGISITTLDNPGWALKIEVRDTDLSNHLFDEVKHQGPSAHDWFACHVKDNAFEAFCGPMHLRDVMVIFLQWAGSFSSSLASPHSVDP